MTSGEMLGITVTIYLSIRKLFPCLHSLILNTREGLGEFETVEGLHNFREFIQTLECLYQAMQTQEEIF